MRRVLPLLALAWLLLTAPGFAYTVFLKDGTQLIAREKYKISNGQAIMTLQNGAQVSYPANQIDAVRTEAANKSDYGAVVVLDDGEKAKNAPPPPPPPKKDSLSDLIDQQRATLRKPETSRRPESVDRAARAAKVVPPSPYPDLSLVGEVQEYFRSQGVSDVGVFRGSGQMTPMVQVATGSEAAVFRAIAVAASALLEMRARHADSLAGIELRLESSSGTESRFWLTPDNAKELMTKKTPISTFYVKYVEF